MNPVVIKNQVCCRPVSALYSFLVFVIFLNKASLFKGAFFCLNDLYQLKREERHGELAV